MPFIVDDSSVTLEINLDKIEAGVQNYYELVEAIEVGIEKGILEVAQRTKEKVIEGLVTYGLGDSKLVNAVEVIPHDTGVEIKVGEDYASFVEFGTGVVGSRSPHKHPWNYDNNSYGDKGWWYPTTADDPNPRKYFSEQAGEWLAWTKGMPSRPFMYYAWLWASRQAPRIINKNIRAECKKIKGVK